MFYARTPASCAPSRRAHLRARARRVDLQRPRRGDDVAMAQVLFDDGKRLMARGQWDEACPKLADSQRLSPAIGTEFNLADCDEHEGKLASAWGVFIDVVDLTHKRGETQREMAARARVAALEPRLGKLTIRVPSRAPDKLEVVRDGQVVRPETWSVPVPVDAGEHRIEVRAPGRVAWVGTVATRNAEAVAIAIPDLAVAPPAPAAPPPAPARLPEPVAPPRARPERTPGIVVFSAGVAFAGVGVLGLVEHASSVNDYNSDPSCPSIAASARPARCNDYVNTASTWDTVGTVGLVAGGVAVVAGAALWIFAPSRPPTVSHVLCAPGIGTVACAGTF